MHPVGGGRFADGGHEIWLKTAQMNVDLVMDKMVKEPYFQRLQQIEALL